MTNRLRLSLCLLAAAVLVGIGLYSHADNHSERASYARLIQRLNAQLPANLDGETESDSVSLAWSSREIRYLYTLVHYNASEINAKQFAPLAYQEHLRTLCEQNRAGLESAIHAGLKFRHNYVGADGKPIASIVVDPRRCLSLAPFTSVSSH